MLTMLIRPSHNLVLSTPKVLDIAQQNMYNLTMACHSELTSFLSSPLEQTAVCLGNMVSV